MPKTAINYNNTIIYRLVCNDTNISDCYIGHTTDIVKRRYQHKSICNNEKSKHYNLKVYQFIRENNGWSNWSLIQIEEFVCNNVNEAKARERYHIELLKPSLNCNIPNRTHKESNKKYRENNFDKVKKREQKYREQNADKIKESHKEYYEENIELIKERKKEYRKQNADKIKEYIKKMLIK